MGLTHKNDPNLMHPVAALLFGIAEVADLFAPEVTVDEDGNIEFDWMYQRGVVLTISLGVDGKYAWAAMINGWVDSGTGILPAITTKLREAIERFEAACEGLAGRVARIPRGFWRRVWGA